MLDAKNVSPAKPRNIEIAEALHELNITREALDAAKLAIPSYTGQYSSEDYIAQEQEAYNRATDVVGDLLRANHV